MVKQENSRSFGERIRQVRGGKSLTEFAAGFGIHKNTLARYEKGDGVPDGAFLAKICEVYHINPVWILTGEGPVHPPDPEDAPLGTSEPVAPSDAEGLDPDVYVYVPLYNVVASGGDGSFLDAEEVVDALAFKREWIRTELKANPKDLVLVMMTGESMEPTLGKDDVLLVNRRVGPARSDGIYLIRLGDALLVKRLQFLPDSEVRVISDNPAYDPFGVRPSDADTDFRIIGRVVWAGRKF